MICLQVVLFDCFLLLVIDPSVVAIAGLVNGRPVERWTFLWSRVL